MNKQIKKIPKKWKLLKVEDVCTNITSGGTPRRSNNEYWNNGKIPWVKTGELNDTYINNTEEKMTEKGLKNSSAKLFPKNTVLVAMYGATIGKTGVLNIESTTNQACCALMANEDKINYKYLHYYLMSKTDYYTNLGQGGAQPNINQGIIKNTDIPVPPLEKQLKIVKKLNVIFSSLDVINELQKEANKIGENIMSAAIASVFNKLDNVKEEKLSDLAKINPRYKLKKGKKYPYLEMASVNEYSPTVDYYKTREYSSGGYCKFKNGDVLYARITPCTENKKMAIIDNDLTTDYAFGSTELVNISPGKKLNPYYVYYYMLSLIHI